MWTNVSSLGWIISLILFINIIFNYYNDKNYILLIFILLSILIIKNILFCILEIKFWNEKLDATSNLDHDNKMRCATSWTLIYLIKTLIYDIISILIFGWIISFILI